MPKIKNYILITYNDQNGEKHAETIMVIADPNSDVFGQAETLFYELHKGEEGIKIISTATGYNIGEKVEIISD